MPRVKRQIMLVEDINRPVTPDMGETKLIKPEFIDIDGITIFDELQAQKVAEETPSPHLQDHQYGQTPCYQITKRPAPQTPRAEISAVKRRLNLEMGPSQSTFKAPRVKRKRSGSITNNGGHTPTKSKTVERTRYDTSLSLLTKKFINLVEESKDGVVDLNVASEKLEVQKRRIYDITNVLEGIGILEKKSKNNIQWKGTSLPSNQSNIITLRKELADLEAKENLLDRLITGAQSDLNDVTSDKTYAYVTYQDLRAVVAYKDQSIMAVKAPPDATLHVPQPINNYGQPKLQIHMRSTTEEIEVFLCAEDIPAPIKAHATTAATSSTESIAAPTSVMNAIEVPPNAQQQQQQQQRQQQRQQQQLLHQQRQQLQHQQQQQQQLAASMPLPQTPAAPVPPTQTPVVTRHVNEMVSLPQEFLVSNVPATKVESLSNNSATESCNMTEQIMLSALTSSGMRDALLCESDDFTFMGNKLQMQPEDQHMSSDMSIMDFHFGDPLLALEPPLSESDYSFTLGTGEGLTDLFDLF